MDVDEKGSLERAEDVVYMAAEQRFSLPLEAEARDRFWAHLGEGLGVDLTGLESAGVETVADLHSGASLSTSPMVSAAPVDSALCLLRSIRAFNELRNS